jgi:hypothetical protein
VRHEKKGPRKEWNFGRTRLTGALERETRFGIGASFQSRRQHDVMAPIGE